MDSILGSGSLCLKIRILTYFPGFEIMVQTYSSSEKRSCWEPAYGVVRLTLGKLLTLSKPQVPCLPDVGDDRTVS